MASSFHRTATKAVISSFIAQENFSPVNYPLKHHTHTHTHTHISMYIGGAVVKNPPASTVDTRDRSSIPGSGRSPGIEKGNPLQYSCLGNSMVSGAWWATICGVAKSQT